jgi:hypothetical protein
MKLFLALLLTLPAFAEETKPEPKTVVVVKCDGDIHCEGFAELKAELAKAQATIAEKQTLLDFWTQSAVSCQVQMTNAQVIRKAKSKPEQKPEPK